MRHTTRTIALASGGSSSENLGVGGSSKNLLLRGSGHVDPMNPISVIIISRHINRTVL